MNLTGMAAVGLAALPCGMPTARRRHPALVGYILAGELLGPGAFVVGDRTQIAGLAEFGEQARAAARRTTADEEPAGDA